jgi:hypothetical protein
VSGYTYTISGPDGSSFTINATSSTTYVNADGSPTDASAVRPGVFIVAKGTPSDSDRTITAERITIGAPKGGLWLSRTGAGSPVSPQR